MKLRICVLTGALFALLGGMFCLGRADAAPYEYKSETYGFSIVCPEKPVGVVELATLSPEEKGDVLIFAIEGNAVMHAWVISDDGFSEAALPDFAKFSTEERENYLQNLKAERHYALTALVDVNGQKGLYAVTEDKPQRVATYFRADGKRFAITLIENPELTKANIEAYQKGVLSFKAQ